EVVERHVAKHLQIRESLVHRYLEGDCGVFQKWRIDEEALAYHTTEQIFELAEQGNVLIRGWGATQLLRTVSHVVCVRVCAPLDARIRTLMGRLKLDDARIALKEIESSDAAHTRVTRRLSQEDWTNPALYDLVLNTERVPIEKCVGLVRGLTEDPAFRETSQSRATLADLMHAARQRRLEMLGNVAPEREPLPPYLGSQQVRASHRLREERPTSREERDLFL
ncbi:MAG: AAA family ATPase, partial [Gammaproteobacteria bacterium]